MNVVVATCGSRGDVQPMLALALALKHSGCAVVLAAPPENLRFARRHGCPFQPLGGNFMAFVNDCANAHTVKPGIGFAALLRQEIAAQFAELPAIVRGADLVLGAALVFGLPSVAEAAGVPYRFVATCPQLLRSAAHPAVGIPFQNLSGSWNRLSWRLSDLVGRIAFRPLIDAQRRTLGLERLHTDALSHLLGRRVIVASDPILGRIPGDTGVSCVQTGYVHLCQPGGRLDERVERFLADGSPPIYAGFGSMPGKDLMGLVPMVLRAARQTGRRVIFPIPPGRLPIGETRDCCFAGETPHARLFPELAAVIHHGGAGTTATAARAGVPQVIVPHLLDQFYWADRIHRLGLGPAPIWRIRLTQGRVVAAIEQCVADRTMQNRARAVASRIRDSDATGQTVRHILGMPP